MKGVEASVLAHVHTKRERERKSVRERRHKRKEINCRRRRVVPSVFTVHLEAVKEDQTRWKQVQARGMKPFGERSEMVVRKFFSPVMCLIDFSANKINESVKRE